MGLADFLKKHSDAPGADDMGDASEPDGDAAELDACKALLQAIHARDPEGMHEALSTFVELCTSKGYDEGESSGSEPAMPSKGKALLLALGGK